MSIEFLLTALIVCLVPGTGVINTLGTALTRARTAMLAAVLGCTLGIVPHLLAAILGLAALLHASALAFQLVKFAGVAFLLYLAWKTIQERGALAVDAGETPSGLLAITVRGALINVLNPKLSLFFLAFLPQFVSPSGGATVQMMSLGAVFMGITALTFVAYGLAASLMRDRVLASPRAMDWIRRSMAGAFALLAGRLAVENR